MDKAETQRCIDFIDGLLGYRAFSPVLRTKLEAEKLRLENELTLLKRQHLEETAA